MWWLALNEKQSLGHLRLAQVLFGYIVFSIAHGALDHWNVAGLRKGAHPTTESACHPHQVGIVQTLVGAHQLTPPHAQPAGIMPHPKRSVQHDSIHAIVAATQQILIQTAQSLRHAATLPAQRLRVPLRILASDSCGPAGATRSGRSPRTSVARYTRRNENFVLVTLPQAAIFNPTASRRSLRSSTMR